MTRISTLQLNSLTLGSALGVESQYAQAETQQASGLVASNFATLGGVNSSEMLNLEDGIGQAQTWASNATTVGSRTQSMYTALGNMSSTVSTLESKISAASSTADNSSLVPAVQELQKTLAAEMNTQEAGSYLFAGSNVGEAPVDLSSYPSSTFSVSGSDTSYYTGDDNISSVRISQQQTVSYGVTANSAGFEEALRATQGVIAAASSTLDTGTLTATDPTAASSVTAGTIAINGVSVTLGGGESLDTIASDINTAATSASSAITATVVSTGTSSNPTYTLQISSGSTSTDLTITDGTNLGLSSTTYATSLQTGLKAALSVATSAVTDLADLQESVAAKSSELSDAHDQQTSYVTYLQTSLSNIKDVDTAQVAAQVSQYQTQLQASYLAVAQISKVNLAQYL